MSWKLSPRMFLSSGASSDSSSFLPPVTIESVLVPQYLCFTVFISSPYLLLFPLSHVILSGATVPDNPKSKGPGCCNACEEVSADYGSVSKAFPFQPLVACRISCVLPGAVHAHAQVCVSVALRLWFSLEKDLCLVLASFLWLRLAASCYFVHCLSPRARR